jgi:hypothetical protein
MNPNFAKLAMTDYQSFWQWLFSIGAFEDVLILATEASFVCLMFFVLKRRPLPSPYFSGIFVLTLCPFLCSSLLAVHRVYGFLLNDPLDSPNYITGRLLGPVRFAMNGAYASVAALIIYSVAFALGSKSRHANSQSQQIP